MTNEKLKVAKGGVFKKGNYWYEKYDPETGHMNEWLRQQLLKGVNVPMAKSAPKSKSKIKTA
tara:strand:+ start:404 stop:589 length:186 start_codon:yes stop_codon:yes gene_type:complete